MSAFCAQPLPAAARRGILFLQQGKYFEAHEELEAAWRATDPPGRELYQGILQAAVVYLHLERGNRDGAIKVYPRALKHLQPWRPRCQGVDIERLLTHLGQTLDSTASAHPETFAPPQGLISGVRQSYFCDRCGHEMFEQNCKILCAHCGYRLDCSDLTLYW
jgi:hypothetical protein